MRLLRRLAYWLRLSSQQKELADEMAFHRDMIERDLLRQGMSPADAHEASRRRMGNETVMRETSRDVWLWPWLESLVQDATYTLRTLRRTPVFTIGVGVTLALGIGANAAMFSLLDRTFLRPPAKMIDPGTVHRVYLYRSTRGQEFTETGGIYARYLDLARGTQSFSQTAGVKVEKLPMGIGDVQLRNVAIVSASFFGFFDAPPLLGRYFTPAEDAPPNPAAVAVLSQRLWETQFRGRQDVLGSTLHIGAVNYTIIGVAPDGLVGLWPYQAPTAFVPVATFAANRERPNWATSYTTAFGLGIIARRKAGVTIDAANADLTNALQQSYRGEGRTLPPDLKVRAVAAPILAERGPKPSKLMRTATWLGGVTLVVLLIACANVANLMLARTIGRRREIAVRVALGVSRARLFRQLLTEGLVLALFAGAASLAVATWGGQLLQRVYLPGTERVSLIDDPRTLLFTAAIALGVGVFTGLVPMLQVARGTLAGDLRSGVRDGTYQRRGMRAALVIVQCALSVVLLVGAGLFVRSLRHVREVPLGYDTDPVLLVTLNMRDTRLDSATMVALRLRLLQSALRSPGVSHATLQESVPLAGYSSYPIFVSGIDSASKLGTFYVNTVSPDYFKVMGTRLLRGRPLEATDIDGTPRVAVVSESMAAALWRGAEPLGQCFRMLTDTMPCVRVVGVAQDIRPESIDGEAQPYFYYLPAAQWHPEEGGLFVRARADARLLAEPLREQLQREMPGTAFVTVSPLSRLVDARVRPWTAGASVFTAFGALALLLAAIGLYSVIAYNVSHRRQEIGVRLALGADRGGIVRIVLGEGLRFAGVGIAIGVALALVASRWIAPLLFQQSPYDPGVLGTVGAVLFGVAIAAGSIPALRAASVDPRTALQAD